MIVSSAPLRFSFNGGGSDLPVFFERERGRTVSIALDKRVYVTLHKSFSGEYRIAYSRIESCKTIAEIRHPIVRACLEILEWDEQGLEITSIADVPSSGSGLGSSSAFTVALLNGILFMQGKEVNPRDLARLACEVEVDILKSPIGFQDQHASSHGGLNKYEYKSREEILVEPIFTDHKLEQEFIAILNKHLLFFHVGGPRNAADILLKQNNRVSQEREAFLATRKLSELALESSKSIKAFDIKGLGEQMFRGWKIKSELNGDVENIAIKQLLEWADQTNLIFGAKILGAGNSGFLAVLAPPENHRLIAHQLNFLALFSAKLIGQGPRVGEF